MTCIEIRKGLRKLDFAPAASPSGSDRGTHVTVEFEIGSRLAAGQLVSINLGLHDGVARELKGKPVLVSEAPSYRYRLEGDVA